MSEAGPSTITINRSSIVTGTLTAAEIALARVLNIPIMHLFGAKRVEDTQVVL